MTRLSVADLWSILERQPRRCSTLLIGIDGPGGAGKSTLAASLAAASPCAQVVHIDDFYLPKSEQPPAPQPAGGNFDWCRLDSQVLAPLCADLAGRYRRYDWGTDALQEWVPVRPGGAVIVEGVTATRAELRDRFDIRIFVDCTRELRLRRGVERDGEDARTIWQEIWMPAEQRYLAEHEPEKAAHIVVDGSCAEEALEQNLLVVAVKLIGIS